MKIAIIASGFLPVVDGVTVSGLYRVQKLSNWGHQVLLFCPDYSSLADIYPNWRDYSGEILPGVRVVNLESTPFLDIDFERNVSRRSYAPLLKELEKFQPDIIHVDEPERLFSGFLRRAGIDFARINNIPSVGFFRTNFLEYADDFLSLPEPLLKLVKSLFVKFLAWVYNSYDATLIHSKITQQKLIQFGIKNTVYDNLNGFDPSKFDNKSPEPDFFAKKYGLPQIDRQVKLIFVGRLTPDKGWKFTIDAFKQIGKAIDLNNLALIVAGDGEMYRQIATELGEITPHLHLLGRVSPNEVVDLSINSDIYVTTSEKENRSLAIIEALAAGLPILAPRAGGIPQDVEDGKSGFLFTGQDRNDFVIKLKLLVENPTLRQKMGLYGKQYIQQYSWDRTIANLVAIWERQIEMKREQRRNNYF
ncbi:MAG: glycosyltransferase [Xenococcaceae cyanobacterium]